MVPAAASVGLRDEYAHLEKSPRVFLMGQSRSDWQQAGFTSPSLCRCGTDGRSSSDMTLPCRLRRALARRRKGREIRGGPVWFPLPVLPRIEELLQEEQWLDGLILITDSDRA